MPTTLLPDTVQFQASRDKLVKLRQHWPSLHRVIQSGDETRIAFEKLQNSPGWRDDPRLKNIPEDVATELLDFYNKVVEDGRFVEKVLADPKTVAAQLELPISDRAVELAVALNGHSDSAIGAGAIVVISIAVVAIAVAVAIHDSAADRRSKVVIDSSGKVKLGSPIKSKAVTSIKTKIPVVKKRIL